MFPFLYDVNMFAIQLQFKKAFHDVDKFYSTQQVFLSFPARTL